MTNFRFSTLRGRFMYATLGVIGLLLVSKLVFQIITYVNDTQSEIESGISNTLSLGTSALSLPYWNLDKEVMKSIATAILEDRNVAKVEIYNYHSVLDIAVEDEGYSFSEKDFIIGEGDIYFRDYNLGTLRIWITKENYRLQLFESIFSLVSFFVLEVIFMIIVISRATDSVSVPLERLTSSAEIIARGDLDQEIHKESIREIGVLSDAFDNMRKQIKDNILELTRDRQEISALYEEASALNETLEDLLSKLDGHYDDTIRTLANAIEANDEYTKGHCERVSKYAMIIGKKISLSNRDLSILSKASILHDIGKIGIPYHILNKEERLTADEYDAIKNHSEIGYQILKDVEFLTESAQILRDHHERPDGLGYPRGLKSNEISLFSSIISVVDAYDAMTQARAYRKKPLSQEEAIEELLKYRGTQFDYKIVDIWVDIIRNGEDI